MQHQRAGDRPAARPTRRRRADQPVAPASGRAAVDLVLGIDPARPEPLHRQLYSGLRSAILDQRLKPGIRLPSTRALATTLGLARNTVHGAYDQLLAEGYLETRHGAGTYVATSLPDDALRAGVGTAGGAGLTSASPSATAPDRRADRSGDSSADTSTGPVLHGQLSRWG